MAKNEPPSFAPVRGNAKRPRGGAGRSPRPRARALFVGRGTWPRLLAARATRRVAEPAPRGPAQARATSPRAIRRRGLRARFSTMCAAPQGGLMNAPLPVSEVLRTARRQPRSPRPARARHFRRGRLDDARARRVAILAHPRHDVSRDRAGGAGGGTRASGGSRRSAMAGRWCCSTLVNSAMFAIAPIRSTAATTARRTCMRASARPHRTRSPPAPTAMISTTSGPGLRAAGEHDVVHPYVEAGIDKAGVYALAASLGAR